MADNVRCLNCFSPMQDGAHYCQYCGQKRIGPRDHSVWHLTVEAVGDFFHLDSKFFTTIRPLMFRPGLLTSEYLEGRQARYFHPIKMFLFLSFLYFLTSGILDHSKQDGTENLDRPTSMVKDTTTILAKRGTYNLALDKAYAKGINIPDDSLRKMVHTYGLNQFVSIRFPHASAYQKYIIKKVIRNRLDGLGNMDEAMGKTLPKMVFVFIPFFAFLLKLVYRKKRLPYFNHVVFSLHFLSFFFLLFWIKELISLLSWWFNPLMVILLLGYLFFALRRVYGLNNWETLWKFLLFLIGSLFALLIFIIISGAISFMMI